MPLPEDKVYSNKNHESVYRSAITSSQPTAAGSRCAAAMARDNSGRASISWRLKLRSRCIAAAQRLNTANSSVGETSFSPSVSSPSRGMGRSSPQVGISLRKAKPKTILFLRFFICLKGFFRSSISRFDTFSLVFAGDPNAERPIAFTYSLAGSSRFFARCVLRIPTA